MKKILFSSIILFGLLLSNLNAQTVNDIPINEIDVEYIQIVGTSKLLSNKVTIQIDFGQENKYWSNKDTQVKDESGKLLVFNSMIDSLNFLSENGYEFVNAYAITLGNQNVYHYILKRKDN
ncbi:hypothetical protein [Belliella aquatica]|uniref:Uncharacterized protein n=1 Tax=Belliella aquatica TaxID=1323734 RepID=A0ABQ1M3D4_9BACT|nr:hypothetical protein [Belliella aquatica]MCH7406824.1 hypothetical protein [Belliella aquatica]GGC32454.1 hypothetical protein GCM10010993_09280 [Belliella aquatica]